MPSARYWRLVGLLPRSSEGIELSEIALYDGATRVDPAASITATHTPISGSLGNLTDADTATYCRFSDSDVRSSGFAMQWDFGTAQNLSEIKLGAANSIARFPRGGALEYLSVDGVWVRDFVFENADYPGNNQYTTSSAGGLTPTTWNPLDKGSSAVLSNGNLTASGQQTNGSVRSIFGVSSGKYYWEVTSTGVRYPIVGVGRASATLGNYPGADANGWAYYGGDGANLKVTSGSFTAYGSLWTSPSDVIGVALDMDAGTLTFYKNGVSMGTAFTGITGVVYAMTGGDTNATPSVTTANFGASPMVYGPPAGFTAGLGEQPGKVPVSSAYVPLATPASNFNAFWREEVSGSVGASSVRSAAAVRDIYLAGRGSITATVKEDGTPTDTPVRRKVRLFRDRDGLLVRETWSDATTGTYSFAEINENETYSVVSYDHNDNYRAVIADRITPTVA